MPRYNAPYERDRPPRFRPYMGAPRYGGPGNWRGPRPPPPHGAPSRDSRPPSRGAYGHDGAAERDSRDRRMSYSDRRSEDFRGSRQYDRQDSRDSLRRERQDSYPGTDTPPQSFRSHHDRNDKYKGRDEREPKEREKRSRWDNDRDIGSPPRRPASSQDTRRDPLENTDSVPMDMSPEHDSAEEAGDIIVDDSEQGRGAGIEQTSSFDEALWRQSAPQRDSPMRNYDSSSNISAPDSSSQHPQQPHSAQNLYSSSSQGYGHGHSQTYGYGSSPHSLNNSVPNASSNSPAMTPAHVPPHLSGAAPSGHSPLVHTSSAPLSHGHPFSNTPHRGGKQRMASLSHQQSFPGGIGSMYSSGGIRGSGPNTPTGIGSRNIMPFGGPHQQGMIARQRIEAALANDKTILAHLVNWPTEPFEKKLIQSAEDSRKSREKRARIDMDLRQAYCSLDIAELKVAICDKRREAIQQELAALERPVATNMFLRAT